MPEKGFEEIAEKTEKKLRTFDCRIFCCNSTGCQSSGSGAVIQALKESITSRKMEEKIEIVPTGCMGLCSLGPLVRIEITAQEPVLYKEVTPMLARLIFAEHILPAVQKREEGFYIPPDFLTSHIYRLDIPFFTYQNKVVLRNSGYINPENIEEYIFRGGYEGLRKVLTNYTGEQVIEEIKKSCLRGRGGGGFPAGIKWENTRIQGGEEKHIICNGDEGDPGAYMDRSILEGDPHSVLEGMMIAGYAAGASQGWLYIRAEYPLAIARMEKAIRQAKKHKLLGNNILGTDFSFSCEIRLGAGAFVCGEETALIASIEGKRGTPRPRPPYPSQSGLWGCPTSVNNVETLASVPPIIRRGADWFLSIGTEKSRGTKVFALTGKVQNSGLIEVPMGISLRTIVDEIGGGTSTGKKLKAVQTGGPSGGVIPERLLDTKVCYEELQELGSIIGSGGMIVMDEDDSMVDIASFYLNFTVDESCGKCAPCRIGGKQLLDLLEKIAGGRGEKTDLEKVRRIAEAMKQASLCGLGQTAPNPVLSTLRYFEDEYLDKIQGAQS